MTTVHALVNIGKSSLRKKVRKRRSEVAILLAAGMWGGANSNGSKIL
jgi:hypothetical protein